jgi:hypothetical protein
VQCLPQRDAEGELIRGRLEALAEVLLGGHVCRRPEHEARLDERIAVRVATGEAEVHHARSPIVADDHVLRLEVAMDDPLRVGGLQAATCLHEDAEDLPPRSRALPQPHVERAPADELHRHVHVPRFRVDVVNRNDVGVRQSCQRLRFADEASAARAACT